MEVHHHPIAVGSQISRKNWGPYFWEFVALFLAPDGNPSLRLNEDAVFRLNYRIHMLTVFNRTLRRDGRKLLMKATSLLELLKNEYHLSADRRTPLEK